MMGNEDTLIKQLKDPFCKLTVCRRASDHLIVDTGQCLYMFGDGHLRIYELFKAINHLQTIMDKNSDFGDPASRCVPTRCFNIYNGVLEGISLGYCLALLHMNWVDWQIY